MPAESKAASVVDPSMEPSDHKLIYNFQFSIFSEFSMMKFPNLEN
jgi:hypothetical protein